MDVVEGKGLMFGDKNRGERGGDGRKWVGPEDESFTHGVQSFGNRSPVGLVNSIKTGPFVSMFLFFSRASILSS